MVRAKARSTVLAARVSCDQDGGHQTGHEIRLRPNDTTDNMLDGGPEEGMVDGCEKRHDAGARMFQALS